MEEKDQPAVELSHDDQEFMDELRQLLMVARHPRTLKLLQDAIKQVGRPSSVATGGIPGKINGVPKEGHGSDVTGRVSGHSKSSLAYGPTTRIKDYGWDQSEVFVKIYVTSTRIEGDPDRILKDFKERSMMVQFVGAVGKTYSLVVNDLFGAIVPEQSHIKVKSGNVTICLRKKEKRDWPFLTAREKKLKDAREAKPPGLEKDEDPGLGLMKVMKQMYDEGDDEMKRTIAKAWHESQEKKTKGAE